MRPTVASPPPVVAWARLTGHHPAPGWPGRRARRRSHAVPLRGPSATCENAPRLPYHRGRSGSSPVCRPQVDPEVRRQRAGVPGSPSSREPPPLVGAGVLRAAPHSPTDDGPRSSSRGPRLVCHCVPEVDQRRLFGALTRPRRRQVLLERAMVDLNHLVPLSGIPPRLVRPSRGTLLPAHSPSSATAPSGRVRNRNVPARPTTLTRSAISRTSRATCCGTTRLARRRRRRRRRPTHASTTAPARTAPNAAPAMNTHAVSMSAPLMPSGRAGRRRNRRPRASPPAAGGASARPADAPAPGRTPGHPHGPRGPPPCGADVPRASRAPAAGTSLPRRSWRQGSRSHVSFGFPLLRSSGVSELPRGLDCPHELDHRHRPPSLRFCPPSGAPYWRAIAAPIRERSSADRASMISMSCTWATAARPRAPGACLTAMPFSVIIAPIKDEIASATRGSKKSSSMSIGSTSGHLPIGRRDQDHARRGDAARQGLHLIDASHQTPRGQVLTRVGHDSQESGALVPAGPRQLLQGPQHQVLLPLGQWRRGHHARRAISDNRAVGSAQRLLDSRLLHVHFRPPPCGRPPREWRDWLIGLVWRSCPCQDPFRSQSSPGPSRVSMRLRSAPMYRTALRPIRRAWTCPVEPHRSTVSRDTDRRACISAAGYQTPGSKTSSCAWTARDLRAISTAPSQ
nr:MAG TPA: hypothetical protein [Caudoviricetes sp.]